MSHSVNKINVNNGNKDTKPIMEGININEKQFGTTSFNK